ncbi:hypothetical protein PF005_g11259 [Phytophthora fragariae]|uniref:Uncharacterized protein n=1 Tax=Phytophthora fragariae TaxID=53985 RepID=A0A6A3Y0X2_9STRA|nr:hypothetical protein PF007_g11446 [Phytophthora fragariae]KAE9210805.1 hypothetical protein PF005_g11259 [Phytophthora fragariae]KAE9309525.1 hypothetical protein PF001_g10639 [Phytophthora fragariae]KAE9339380.1 hypothetical protein PF008_g11606 [Phytophthora fragariae]
MTDWSSALFDTLSKRAARWQHAAAERDKEVNVLEDRHEQLLLRNAQLGQQNNALRQRLVSAAARKIHRILELGRKSRVEVALEVWKHKLRQIPPGSGCSEASAAGRDGVGNTRSSHVCNAVA